MKELRHLALAITLAGSYVRATPRLQADITDYLPQFRARRKELLAQQPKWLVHQYGESVLTTWETTFQVVEGQSQKAARVLSLNFLNEDDIFPDFSILDTTGDDFVWTTSVFQDAKVNRYDIEEVFRILQGFLLMKFQSDQGSYSMHKLVSAGAYDRLELDARRQYGCSVALLLCHLNVKTEDADH